MISRLMIANRGEIACRIARTARSMGIGTVGVYSEADRHSLYISAVDVAIHIGGPAPADSYLQGDVIIAAALAHGCNAIHPGYGFLAENASFARDVIEAGLTWVGPTPDQIATLGNKVAAKTAAVEAGVPTTSAQAASPTEIPTDAPMPALIKAAAGGGGRGMRIARTHEELADAIAAAAREAEAAFGDGTVFIEPYIEHGRHIEVQIIGDTYGNVIHLGDRECSIQRRNQKILEEAPSAGISDSVRGQLLDGALALAHHVGYENAGTVEFLVGPDESITFLEVNTRLQVEHPVTEAVTGLDLVELQLLVAAGEPLPLTQDDVQLDGHAIEVRVVAEDPTSGWLPQTGPIQAFELVGDVRVDAGFDAGMLVTSHYDSLLAKIIAHGADRAACIQTLRKALDTSVIVGPTTNLAMLRGVLRDQDFWHAATTTSYIDDHPDRVQTYATAVPGHVHLLLGALFAAEFDRRENDTVTGFAPSGWRNVRTRGTREEWWGGHELLEIEYTFMSEDEVEVRYPGAWPRPAEDGHLEPDDRGTLNVRLLARSTTKQVIELDGVVRTVHTTRVADDTVLTRHNDGAACWTLEPQFVVPESNAAGSGPICPLPGTVIAVEVEPGQMVVEGQALVVVEAMKMEHTITSAIEARVVAIPFVVGDRVDQGDLLVELEVQDAPA